MGRIVGVYLVDLEKVRGAVGSGDDLLRRRIEVWFGTDFDRSDKEAGSSADPTARESLRAVIDGGPYRDGHGHCYAAAYQNICGYYASWESAHGPYHRDWLSEVDDALYRLGIHDIGLTAFEDGPATPLPWIFDGGYGEWSHDDCVRAAMASDAMSAGVYAGLDGALREWVDIALEWARVAAARPGYGLAGFFTI